MSGLQTYQLQPLRNLREPQKSNVHQRPLVKERERRLSIDRSIDILGDDKIEDIQHFFQIEDALREVISDRRQKIFWGNIFYLK